MVGKDIRPRDAAEHPGEVRNQSPCGNPLPLDLDTHLPSYLAECRQRLEDILTTVAAKARANNAITGKD